MLAGALLVPHDDEKSVEDFIATAQAERAAANFPAGSSIEECAGEGPREPRRAALVRPAIYRSRGRRGRQGQLRHARQDGATELEMAELRAEAELLARQFEDVVRHTAPPPAGASTDLKASMLAARASAYLALSETDAALE